MSENLSESSPLAQSSVGTMASDAKQQMLDTAQAQGTRRYRAAREKLREQWAGAKEDLDIMKQRALDYSHSAAKVTNTFAHDHPWTTAGAAAGVGALIGWLVSRRTDMHQSPRS